MLAVCDLRHLRMVTVLKLNDKTSFDKYRLEYTSLSQLTAHSDLGHIMFRETYLQELQICIVVVGMHTSRFTERRNTNVKKKS